MDEAESSQSPNEAYYRLSPLGFLGDSYFTQPQYGDQQYGNQQAESSAQLGLGIDYLGGLDYTAPISPFSTAPTNQHYQTQRPMEQSLLSANTYLEGTFANPHTGRGEGTSTRLYGGLLAKSPNTASPPSSSTTDMKTRTTSGKDGLKGAATDESSSRQRGRPRLDTRDQNAGERRRTQIRLAQRAYRQRKESTISGLNSRVASLEKTIEDMHQTFLTFNDRAIASGIRNGNPALAEHLSLTAERLASLAKTSAQDSDAEDEGLNQILSEQVAEGHERQRSVQATSNRPETDRDPMLGYQASFNEEADDDDDDAMQRFQIELPGASEATSSDGLSQLDTNNGVWYCAPLLEGTCDGLLPFSGGQLVTGYPYSIRAPEERILSDLSTLPSPTSCSFQEASFARRLLRASLEAAYRLMTDPNSRPEDIRRLCTFTWCFTNPSRIRDRIKNLLERTAKQNLEHWEVPAMHLGGAGLHYPRVGIDTGGAPPEWWANEAPMGPFRPSQPETPVPGGMRIAQIAEHVGFEGEWLDSNDVEQYLRSKGLYLDGHSSLVEIHDPAIISSGFNSAQGPSASSPNASIQGSTGGSRSPQNPDIDWPADPLLQGTDYGCDDDKANIAELPDLNMDFAFEGTNFSSQEDLSGNFPNCSVVPDTMTFGTKIKKLVDVDRFLNSTYDDYKVVKLGY